MILLVRIAGVMLVPALLVCYFSRTPWQMFLLLWFVATMAVWVSVMDNLKCWDRYALIRECRNKHEAMEPREHGWSSHHKLWLSHYPLKDHGVVSKYLACLLINNELWQARMNGGEGPSEAQVEYWICLERQYAGRGYKPLELGDVQQAVDGHRLLPQNLVVKRDEWCVKYPLREFLETNWPYADWSTSS